MAWQWRGIVAWGEALWRHIPATYLVGDILKRTEWSECTELFIRLFSRCIRHMSFQIKFYCLNDPCMSFNVRLQAGCFLTAHILARKWISKQPTHQPIEHNIVNHSRRRVSNNTRFSNKGVVFLQLEARRAAISLRTVQIKAPCPNYETINLLVIQSNTKRAGHCTPTRLDVGFVMIGELSPVVWWLILQQSIVPCSHFLITGLIVLTSLT
jgi:hypothetical protein